MVRANIEGLVSGRDKKDVVYLHSDSVRVCVLTVFTTVVRSRTLLTPHPLSLVWNSYHMNVHRNQPNAERCWLPWVVPPPVCSLSGGVPVSPSVVDIKMLAQLRFFLDAYCTGQGWRLILSDIKKVAACVGRSLAAGVYFCSMISVAGFQVAAETIARGCW